MTKRTDALEAFKAHFAFKDNPIAWSAWKMAWDLAYNKALDDALELYYNPTSMDDQDTFDRDLERLKID